MPRRKRPENAIIVDTNVLLHDPGAIKTLREGGNTLFIPITVVLELDRLKDKPNIGFEAREATRLIEKLILAKDTSLEIVHEMHFSTSMSILNSQKADHQILAMANTILFKNKKSSPKKDQYDKVKFISRDTNVRILARKFLLGAEVDDYNKDKTEVEIQAELPELHVPVDIIKQQTDESGNNNYYFNNSDLKQSDKSNNLPENSGAVCFSGWSPGQQLTNSGISARQKWGKSFTAIKKGKRWIIISKDISAFDVKAYSMNGNGPNWAQQIALAQLLDKDISLVFLQGGAGTGKTLLAIAAALEQRKDYRQILITRPFIHLEDKDTMGFLPGDIDSKTGPWLKPIEQNLNILSDIKGDNVNKSRSDKISSNEKIIREVKEKNKISVEPLDYIRGQTFVKKIIIIDEAQNLTPHQIKTIITRAGEGSKIIFTGDLGQIDLKFLDAQSSGLAYAIQKMNGHKLVAVVNFQQSVRSELASLADSLL